MMAEAAWPAGETAASFARTGYLYEPERQGVRLLLCRSNVETRCFTEDGKEVTRLFPELYAVPVEGTVVLDGELYSEHALSRLRMKPGKALAACSRQCPVTFMVRDILFENGRDLRKKPYLKRKSILKRRLLPHPSYALMPYADGSDAEEWTALLDYAAVQHIIANPKNGLYIPPLS